MNKFYIYLKEKILFGLTGLILFTGLMCLSGCSLFESSPLVLSTTELQVSLPDTSLIPFEISRWEVKVTSGGETNSFYVDGSKRSFNASVDSNYPAAISATPLVISPVDHTEKSFFQSAGQIYPYGSDIHYDTEDIAVAIKVIVDQYECPPPPVVYETGLVSGEEREKEISDNNSGCQSKYVGTNENKKTAVMGDTNCCAKIYEVSEKAEKVYPDGHLYLTWEDGFVAYIMERLFMGHYSYYEKPEVVNYIAGFNWKKFQLEIQKKCDEGYNPWLIDAESLLTAIAYKNFNTYSISLKDTTSVSADAVNGVVSSYVPDNKKISEKSEIWIKKSEVNVFSDYNLNSVTASVQSGGVVALEFIPLPLYSDSYEKKCEGNMLVCNSTLGDSCASNSARFMP